MALPVDVQAIDVIREFRAHLVGFGDDARNALAATDMEISRMVDWLTNDRRLYWQAEIRRRREELSAAKTELFRKRTSQMFGHEASLVEQREKMRLATLKLEEAEGKLERVKRWVQPLQQAIMEYRGRSRPLADMLDSDLENALALLDRMIGALEEYVAAPPPTRDVSGASSRRTGPPASPEPESGGRDAGPVPAAPPPDGPESEAEEEEPGASEHAERPS